MEENHLDTDSNRDQTESYQNALIYVDEIAAKNPAAKGLDLLRGSVHQSHGYSEKAIASFRDELKKNPRCFLSHSNLGVLLFDRGDIPEALASLKLAMLTALNHPLPYYNLGNAMRTLGRLQEACIYYQQSLKLDPKQRDAWINLAPVLRALGRRQQARNAYEQVLKLDPQNETAKYFLTAMDQQTAAAAPRTYVSSLFDDYADRFDEHLTNALEYSLPTLLSEMINTCIPNFTLTEVCDLGCGTGLIADALAKPGQIWTGVDLSAKMLAKARDKGAYSYLIQEDILDFLRQTNTSYECIIAADTLPYLGDLVDFFKLAYQRLVPGGWLILSVEKSDTKNPFTLQETGRFQHSPAYIDRLSQDQSFKCMARKQTVIRRNANQDIEGLILVLRTC